LSYQHRAADHSLPEIEISTDTDEHGDEVLLEIEVREKRSALNPLSLVDDPNKLFYHSKLEKEAGKSTYTTYDPRSGYKTSYETKDKKGIVHVDFDEHYRDKSRDMVGADGTAWHTDYDTATGKAISETRTNKDGVTTHEEFDANGKVKSRDTIRDGQR